MKLTFETQTTFLVQTVAVTVLRLHTPQKGIVICRLEYPRLVSKEMLNTPLNTHAMCDADADSETLHILDLSCAQVQEDVDYDEDDFALNSVDKMRVCCTIT